MRKLFVVTLLVGLVGSAFAQTQGTGWLGTSLMFETNYQPGKDYTLGFGFAPIRVDKDNGGSSTRVGLAGEVVYYTEGQPRGLAYVGRVGLVDGGLYAAPGIYAVNRPRDPRAICWRGGALVALGDIDGGKVLPLTLELSVGIRF